ncbi:tetratricopeptide repeat domain-containing protein [Xylaria sp. FL0043]|nr:tetratricopeptide repeat domain-containing protein [Xylaria sp. FL0043]
MAEIIGILSGSASLVDICARLTIYIKELKADCAALQHNLDALFTEIVALEQVNHAVKIAYKNHAATPETVAHARQGLSSSPTDTGRAWNALEKTIKSCHTILQELLSILEDICQRKHTLAKVYAFRSKTEDIRQRQSQLVMYHDVIQMYLILINGDRARISFEVVISRLDMIQSQISTGNLASNQEALRDLKVTVVNEHFHTPQPVSSIYTGREELLEELKDKFIQRPGYPMGKLQRRFVIHGLGGSGKTQFCCKFAEDNRHSFWGVFYVDGSSVSNIKKSMGEIARLAGKEPNANAAIEWLSSVKERWLLLFDNADDPRVDVDSYMSYFPKGEGGHILITTRNQFFEVLGTVGSRYFSFSGLQSKEASELLLKATCLPLPWESELKASASKIIEALGNLALAVVQAGAAIRERLCSLQEYLGWYRRGWKKLQNLKVRARTSNEKAIWTTFELCYKHLEEREDQEAADAIQLLQLFSFLYRDSISPDILIRAMKNATLEAEQARKDEIEEEQNAFRKQRGLGGELRRRFGLIFMFIFGINNPTPLLPILRDGRQTDGFELAKDRISGALSELAKMSLVYYNSSSRTYTMHPVVHDWARNRPGMSLSHQALWAEMAGYTLSASILLPPLGVQPEDELFNSSLLHHIEHVQKCRVEYQGQLEAMQSKSWLPWLKKRLSPTISPDRIRMYAKFSLIYAQCWQLKDAKALLSEVVAALISFAGPESQRTRNAQLALAQIYFELGKSEEAVNLQRSIAEVCEHHFGRKHPETLRTLHKLSQTLFQQGRYSAALKIQTEVVDGLTELLGRNHKDTLEAINQLGMVVARSWYQSDLEKAIALYFEALDGMTETFGADNLRTAFVKENIVRTYCLIGGTPRLQEALRLAEDVIATRKEKMGKEAGWTLLALGDKAVVLGALGRLREAEELMRYILPIATRNTGADHIGVLFGRQVLATILIQQRQFTEAESILLETAESQKTMSSRRGSYHPDRIGSLIELARCYQLQGKLSEGIKICDEAIQALQAISEKRHLFTEILTKARSMMLEQKEAGENRPASTLPATNSIVKFPEHLFKLYGE